LLLKKVPVVAAKLSEFKEPAHSTVFMVVCRYFDNAQIMKVTIDAGAGVDKIAGRARTAALRVRAGACSGSNCVRA
jgi:hypothetical protein